jgi:DNA-binding GntR family transcriptional regulator
MAATRKADIVAEKLKSEIIEGIRPPGTRLDERGLAEEFNVSRTPVREAIRQLASIGLLNDLGRGGIKVAKPDASAILDAFLVVSELEGIAARLAAQRMTPEQLRLAKQANEACREATTVKDFNTANMAFHNAVIAGSHNKLLHEQLNSARPITFPYRHHLTRVQGYTKKSVVEHAEIIDLIEKGDAKAAQIAMCDHVKLQGEEIINILQALKV